MTKLTYNDNLYALSKIRLFILYSGLWALVQYKSYFLGGRKDCINKLAKTVVNLQENSFLKSM